MIANYKRLTRWELNLKAEKAAKTLQYRNMDIDWMESLMYSNRMIMFSHNPTTNRPEVIGSTMQQIPMIQQHQMTTPQIGAPVQQQIHAIPQMTVQQHQMVPVQNYQSQMQNVQPQKTVFTIPSIGPNTYPAIGTTGQTSFSIPNLSKSPSVPQPVIQSSTVPAPQSAVQQSEDGLVEDELFG